MKRHAMVVAALLVPLAAACKRDTSQNNVTGLPDPADIESRETMAQLVFGDVVETMNVPQYTYVLLDTGVEKVWAAAPACQVQVGDKLGISTRQPMRGFHSEVLGRDFDVIYFVSAFQNPDGTSRGMASHGVAVSELQGHSAGPTDVDVGEIAKAEGGMTVAEIYAGKQDLAGAEVKFRGKVTKSNAQIMGKNWLHVQDGSGEATAGTHDLTVTTAAAAKVGDIVLVTGKLQLDKDFGFGYKYALLVEDATLVVE